MADFGLFLWGDRALTGATPRSIRGLELLEIVLEVLSLCDAVTVLIARSLYVERLRPASIEHPLLPGEEGSRVYKVRRRREELRDRIAEKLTAALKNDRGLLAEAMLRVHREHRWGRSERAELGRTA